MPKKNSFGFAVKAPQNLNSAKISETTPVETKKWGKMQAAKI